MQRSKDEWGFSVVWKWNGLSLNWILWNLLWEWRDLKWCLKGTIKNEFLAVFESDSVVGDDLKVGSNWKSEKTIESFGNFSSSHFEKRFSKSSRDENNRRGIDKEWLFGNFSGTGKDSELAIWWGGRKESIFFLLRLECFVGVFTSETSGLALGAFLDSQSSCGGYLFHFENNLNTLHFSVFKMNNIEITNSKPTSRLSFDW